MTAPANPNPNPAVNAVGLRLIKALTVAFETEALPYLERYTPPRRSSSFLRIVYRDPRTHRPIAVRYLGRYGDINEIIMVSELREKLAEYREVARKHGIEEARKLLAEFLDEVFDLKLRTGGKWIRGVKEAVEKLATPAPGPYTIVEPTEYRKELEEAVIELREKAKEAIRSSDRSSDDSEPGSAGSNSKDRLARKFMEAIDARDYELSEEERERYLEKIRREVEEAEELPDEEPEEDLEEAVLEAIQEEVDQELLAAAGSETAGPSTDESPTDPGSEDDRAEGRDSEPDRSEDREGDRKDRGEPITARTLVYRVINAINEHDDIEDLDDLVEKAGVPEKHRDAVSHVLDRLVQQGLVILGRRLSKVGEVRLPKDEYEELVKEVAEKFDLPEGTPAREKTTIDLSWIGDVPKASHRERRAVYRIINRFQEIGDEIDPGQVAFELNVASSLAWITAQALERAGFIERVGKTEGGTEVYRWTGPEKVPYRLVDWVVHRFKQQHEEVL